MKAASQRGLLLQEEIEDIVSHNESDEESEDSEEDSEEESNEDDMEPWISWFCSFRGHEFFCEIDEDYIRDNFNLTGLSSMVPHYEFALDIILDEEEKEIDDLSRQQRMEVERCASMLYGLIHSRFIITAAGMQRMLEKYQQAKFGTCPRVFCRGQAVLPIGLSDIPNQSGTNVFCPCCHEVYVPKSTSTGAVDGSFFGTTFAHLFLLLHSQFIPKSTSPPGNAYVPRIFGYKIHQDSPYYQHRKPLVKSKPAAGSPVGVSAGATGKHSKDL